MENEEDMEYLDLLNAVDKALDALRSHVYNKYGCDGVDGYVDAVMELI